MLPLLWIAAKNLKRNWFRTGFTIAGCAVALLAFLTLRTVLWSWNAAAEYASSDRIATRHKVSFIMSLPKRYADDIRAVPGVQAASYASWFGGRIPSKPNEFFANFAVDAPSFLEVLDEMVVDPADKERWLADKKGALVGDALAQKMGWKVGDKVILEGTIYPGNWEFTVDGIYTTTRKSLDRSQFAFHWSYLDDSLPEAQKNQVGWIMSRIQDASQSAEISKSVDAIFDTRDEQTATMSERAMNASFMAGFSAILTGLDVVSFVILGIMLLILGNTIAMGVRERTKEYAVLRAIGFSPAHVRFFVVGEASVLGVLGGLAGVGVAYPFINGFVGRALEENMGAWFPYFRVQPETAALAFALSLGLALVASLLPSLTAGRVSITEALRAAG